MFLPEAKLAPRFDLYAVGVHELLISVTLEER